MNIWFSLIIPLVTIGFLFYKFRDKTTWWEYLLVAGIPLISISLATLIAYNLKVQDTEYWGSWVSSTSYYEEWNQKVPCSHAKYRTESYTYTCGDKTCTGTRQVFDGYEHLYDVDHHPEYWELKTSSEQTHRISQGLFNRIVDVLGNKSFVDLDRNYHTLDGDAYVSVWKGTKDTLYPLTTAHGYKNVVAVSNSIFNFPEVTPEQIKTYGLYDYPKVEGFNQNTILGSGPKKNEAEKELQYINSYYGASKQIRFYILLFKNQPQEAAFLQQAYWKGGNKNEFVTCIGLDNNNQVTWVKPFTWSEVHTMAVNVREEISTEFTDQNKQLDLTQVVKVLEKQVLPFWVRKEFSDFEYINIDLGLGTEIFLWILCIVTSLGTACFVVYNDEFMQAYDKRTNRFR